MIRSVAWLAPWLAIFFLLSPRATAAPPKPAVFSVVLKDGRVLKSTKKPGIYFGKVRYVDPAGRVHELDVNGIDHSRQGPLPFCHLDDDLGKSGKVLHKPLKIGRLQSGVQRRGSPDYNRGAESKGNITHAGRLP